MAGVRYVGASRVYAKGVAPAGRRARPRHQGRRVHGAGRAVGLGQDHRAAHAGRPRAARRGPDRDRRARHQRRAAEGPGHRDGVPELRPVPEQDRRGEHGLRAEDAARAQARAGPAGPRGGPHPRPRRRPARPQAEGALRRPAAARRHGPRHRARAEGLPDGRAAVQPGRQAARADPQPDRRAAAPPGHHHRLRDARPGRGDDDGAPGRGAQRRAAAAVRLAPRALRQPGEPVRGRLHRLPGDEPADRAADRRRRAAGGRRSSR